MADGVSAGAGLELGCFEHFPDELLEVGAASLWRHLSGPSLFRVPGRHPGPLFVSVLLHGNEDTGWQAVQAVLRRHRGGPLPRPMLLFVGNIEAAKAGVRTLPWQEDYNRAWPGTPHPDTPTARLMREVVDVVRREAPFASIDIHNNTGNNPHYACLNSLGEPHLHLARLFGRAVVFFEEPLGVQSAALAPICPAITVECGRPGVAAGLLHAGELINSALALQRFPEHKVAERDLDLMRTFAIVKVPANASFSYDGGDADFRLRGDLDRLNFAELGRGTVFGSLGRGRRRRFEIVCADGAAEAESYFDYANGEIRLARRAIPAMLTLDPNAVRLDCLGYLMHRIGRDGRPIVDCERER